jgi:NhaA family Na+:H+ antiporter
VLLAMTIPSSARIVANQFLVESRDILAAFEKASEQGESSQIGAEQQAALQELEAACDEVQAPLHQLEIALHPWVTYFILPLFALANAGVVIEGDLLSNLALPVSVGVIAGLVIGKPVGISLFTWLAVKARFAVLPSGITWWQIYGVSWLGGIGFTMSLFIASLAFEGTPSLSVAKIGILTASVITAIVGLVIVRKVTSRLSS